MITTSNSTPDILSCVYKFSKFSHVFKAKSPLCVRAIVWNFNGWVQVSYFGLSCSLIQRNVAKFDWFNYNGAFNTYVKKILTFFYHQPTPSKTNALKKDSHLAYNVKN